MEKEKISWEIARHKEKERGGKFYFIIFGVMILLLLFAILQKNFLFGMFVIIATGTILFLSSKRQEASSFSLTDGEIDINNGQSKYPYEKFGYFDIYEFSEDDYEIFLVFKERLKPMLKIRIYKGDKEKIEEFLSKKFPKRKIEPSMIDLISKIIGI